MLIAEPVPGSGGGGGAGRRMEQYSDWLSPAPMFHPKPQGYGTWDTGPGGLNSGSYDQIMMITIAANIYRVLNLVSVARNREDVWELATYTCKGV